ncbi:tetratricopeptide repeat protein [Chlamydia trachomatis]|uniref:Uncharacterized protein n=5 Tax=Chlamydia trachomatis TaxID=813 RepID=O84674_CHLTR|nr:type III secretion system protein CdsG [Chlamydia trachomatis]NP_220186.1 hypothetical protein CT_667 [Chlamydia trachomatis D/UW-3/CX]AAC68262.1 hypothetical protein CT_667 [Chlamydia trachomatis D/UW-3/CX]AAX50945.1 hypothetical protein CTA_0724 [Chlamydia trachomatis A/HAR-13]ADH17459.1 hypothetical protein E150_03550 [Chlamydia trachomatis E/150]ADH18382.1 hypothetical protein G9768_03520 [Chlamydia trachomatis G/9768]ADH19306.1 hypothetical protein G11222_03540 [Chlamydia trachomatis 
MADLDVFKEDFALLFEAGMVAIKQGDEASAKALFQALQVLDPEHTAHELGSGLLHLHKMELTKAEVLFRAIVEKDPENWSAKAFLSLTLMMIVLQQGSSFEVRRESLERCLQLADQVLESCEVESTRALAKSVLDWHDGLVAKSGGPLN